MRDSRRATLSQFDTRTWYRTASLRRVQIVIYNESRQTMPSVLGENALISFLFDSFPLFLTGNASFHSNSDKLSYPPPSNPIFENSLHRQLRWSGNARLHSQSNKLPRPPPQSGIWKLSIPDLGLQKKKFKMLIKRSSNLVLVHVLAHVERQLHTNLFYRFLTTSPFFSPLI